MMYRAHQNNLKITHRDQVIDSILYHLLHFIFSQTKGSGFVVVMLLIMIVSVYQCFLVVTNCIVKCETQASLHKKKHPLYNSDGSIMALFLIFLSDSKVQKKRMCFTELRTEASDVIIGNRGCDHHTLCLGQSCQSKIDHKLEQ